MQQPVQQKLTIAFLLLTAADLAGIISGFSPLHFIAKPLLIPVLMLLLFFTVSTVPGKKLLLVALFFSWMGDVFLLFEASNKNFFIFGLASFLTTHICYIIFFLRIRSAIGSLLLKQPILILLVLAYGVALVWLLFPHLGELKLPVMVYAAVICTMLLCSLHVFKKINSPANRWYVLGASAFVLSDSLLAINKFYQPFAFAGVLIMLTYCAAQYFIVRGFMEQRNA